MSTGIEWTDETWNPVTGCAKVSPGCAHCYAERITERFHGKGSFDRITLHSGRLAQPLRWRKPRRVFVNSMSDLFHDAVPDAFIVEVWAVMSAAPEHEFQVLTKRPGRMASLLSKDSFWEAVIRAVNASPVRLERCKQLFFLKPEFPLQNVWLGTSVENQKWADVRIPTLLETPAAVRFLSCEPLLGPISFKNVPLPAFDPVKERTWPGFDWVIVGGESGPGARLMELDWARSLRDECAAASVPFFLKQLGGHPNKRGHDQALLDGRRWDEFPAHVGEEGR